MFISKKINELEIRQIFENYLLLEKELIRISDLSFASFFPQLLTVIKLKLNIDLNVIINNENYFSTLDKHKTKEILNIYKKDNFSTGEINHDYSLNYIPLKMLVENMEIYLFFCFENIDKIYIQIFENIKNLVQEILVKENNKKNLKDLQSKYKAVMENSKDAIFICDLDSNILIANPVCQEIYGYNSDELINDRAIYINMVAPSHKKDFNRFLTNLAKGELPKEPTQWAWIKKDGKKVYTENTFSMVKDESNHCIGLQIIARNITDRKIKEDEIAEKNKILKVILDNIPAFVWSLDNNGIFKQSFGSGVKILNLEENQLNGLSIYDVYPEHSEEIMSTIEKGETRYLANGETQGKEWFFDNFVLKEDTGKGLFCFSLDITERIQSEKLFKSSIKEKEILLKEIHHRVKNNMQVISSLLSLQSSQIKDKSIRQLFGQCQNRIRSMALVHEVLYNSETLSKINLDKYIHELITLLSGSFGKNNIHYIIESENIYLDITYAIPTGLIINELISNSLKYAFSDNSENPCIRVSVKEYNTKKEIIVEDNGIGFPKDVNFRETETLGLQLINSLVSQIGGEISINSETGTKFFISF